MGHSSFLKMDGPYSKNRKMVRFVQILGNMDHLLNTIFRTKIVLVIAVRDDDDSS